MRSTAITRRPSSCGRRPASTCRRSSSSSATTPPTSKLVYDYISGFVRENDDGTETSVHGRFELFRNHDEYGNRLARPRHAADRQRATRIRRGARQEFPRRWRPTRSSASGARSSQRTGDQHAGEKISDQDLLREVMNTVGKPGQLGESIRCVVSVSMLTEGWDANTVTHILGVRAFGTQLLCEQVVGRGLRRQSYDLNEEGLLQRRICRRARHPVRFHRQAGRRTADKPRKTVRVEAVRPDRDALEIRFPRVEGYRVELPEERLTAKFTADSVLRADPRSGRADRSRKNQGIIGEPVESDRRASRAICGRRRSCST